MEALATRLFAMVNPTAADWIIFVLGMLVVLYIVFLTLRVKKLESKYHQIDKLTLMNSFLITDLTDKKIVKIHRSGDYEIVNPLNGGE